MDEFNPELLKVILSIVGGFVGILLVINGYFIRRLVGRIDKIDETVSGNIPTQAQQIKELGGKFDSLKIDFSHVRASLEEISAIRERVAVLEYAMKVPAPPFTRKKTRAPVGQ